MQIVASMRAITAHFSDCSCVQLVLLKASSVADVLDSFDMLPCHVALRRVHGTSSLAASCFEVTYTPVWKTCHCTNYSGQTRSRRAV